MDGKKRIARLRNAEKWKRLGFVKPLLKKERVQRAEVGLEHKPKVCPEGNIECKDRWGETYFVKKVHPLECPNNFIYRLKQKGFEQLGAGAYSTVLGKPGSNKVIKVSRTLDNWIDYIQWGAEKGYAGKFVPRVFSWKRHQRKCTDPWSDGEWSVAVVERMDKTLDNYAEDMALLQSLMYPANKGNIMAHLYMDDICPGSFEFFSELRKNDYASDIAGKNMMVRKDGTLCITDPACGSIKTEKKRIRSGEFSPTVLWIRLESNYRHRV